MRPREIKAELVLREKKIKSVAGELNIAASSVSQVISGAKKTRYVQEAIAKAIGKSVDEVFPCQQP